MNVPDLLNPVNESAGNDGEVLPDEEVEKEEEEGVEEEEEAAGVDNGQPERSTTAIARVPSRRGRNWCRSDESKLIAYYGQALGVTRMQSVNGSGRKMQIENRIWEAVCTFFNRNVRQPRTKGGMNKNTPRSQSRVDQRGEEIMDFIGEINERNMQQKRTFWQAFKTQGAAINESINDSKRAMERVNNSMEEGLRQIPSNRSNLATLTNIITRHFNCPSNDNKNNDSNNKENNEDVNNDNNNNQ
ncbi:hypothetical protein MBANPS3_012039 [Mucor bainieri]